MNYSPDVFCLVNNNGELLSPTLQATVLAKYSRSPDSARIILKGLTKSDADLFQEKYVVGYGHSSVAELATIPICFENISIVASKFIESWQRPGYAEKSTRYQEFSPESFITPFGAPDTMKKFTKRFYDAYTKFGPKMRKRAAFLMGKDLKNPDVLNDRTVRARAFDSLRYLLPAGTATNVAVVANMLDIQKMISALLGHSNSENQYLGQALKRAARDICPTLVRHVKPNEFQLPIHHLGDLSSKFDIMNPNWYVDIHRMGLLQNPEKVQQAFEDLVLERHGMNWESFSEFMNKRPEYSEVPDIFKTVQLTFDIMTDFGAYRDLQRHRRCEQFAEPLTINYGYVVPDDVLGSEIEKEYREVMDSVHIYDDKDVVHNTNLMQYMTPLGYLHRSQFQMDLKQVYYLTELRTKSQGHISYRRVAYEIFRLAELKYPKLMQWCKAIKPETIGEHT